MASSHFARVSLLGSLDSPLRSLLCPRQVEELVVDKGASKLKETAWDPASPLPPGPPQRDKNGGLASPGQVNTISPPRKRGERPHRR